MTDHIKLQKILLAKCLEDITILENCAENIFTDEDMLKVFKCAQTFAKNFNQLPTKESLYTNMELSNFEISKVSYNAIFDINLKDFDEVWIKSLVESTILYKKFTNNVTNGLSFIKTQKVDPTNVQDVIQKALSIFNSTNLRIFDDNLGSEFTDLKAHFTPFENKMPSGHKWLDDRIGGLTTKKLSIYCGFANVGKSIFLCNDAANHIRAGRDVVFITLEMSEDDVLQRVGANILKMNISDYDRVDKYSQIEKNFNHVVNNSFKKLGRLFVKEFPTSSLTVPQLEQYLNRLTERHSFTPKILIIDYLGIMGSESKLSSDNTYLKLTQTAEALRALSTKLNMAVITAAQLNRSGSNVADFDMAQIGDSLGLAKTADYLYGIIQTPDMYNDKQYDLKILKVRKSLKACKGSRCTYNINYAQMTLEETDNVTDL